MAPFFVSVLLRLGVSPRTPGYIVYQPEHDGRTDRSLVIFINIDCIKHSDDLDVKNFCVKIVRNFDTIY